ncbi:hypothetical protein F5146DRAFT_629888 [Armillaria mellea]|nr:hypothetical protein F5146DRAFT_629888 [Armillaria mellea]
MQRSSLPLDEILAKYDWISSVTLPPDVTSLLHDNVAPSPLRTTQLKASLKGLTIALGEIDGDIDKFRDVVRSLEAHRLCLQSLKNDYETILVPIRRIPEEITMEILRRSWKVDKYMGMWSGRRIAGFNVFEVQEGPWHLGQVCSSWRNVIKTLCPELWASMTIRIPHACEPKMPLGADTTVEMLRVALERSRNHPLDFHFSCYDPLHYSEAEEGISQSMKQCFDIMIAHSDRWRAVEMRIHPSYLPRLSLVRGKIDLLRDMYIDCIDNPPSGHIWAFEIAPKLEILHLKGMHNEADIPFPASNLVSFSDARLFAGDRLTPTYLAVMKSAPKLLSFSYNGYGIQSLHNHPVPDPPSPVIASSVEKLSASSPSFLRSLVLPSLKEVTLTTMYENDMEERVITCPVGALGALHQMLLQSQCSLTRLCLVDADLNDNSCKHHAAHT